MSTAPFEAFRFRTGQPSGKLFAEAFLSSYDFDHRALGNICRDLELPSSGTNRELIVRIIEQYDEYSPDRVLRAITKHLITRTKTAFMFARVGQCHISLQGNISDLVVDMGREEWYGPVQRHDDPDATWYVRPVLIHYKEKDNESEENEDKQIDYVIRWLCFARIGSGIVSLHWHGFTYTYSDTINPKTRHPFQYWDRVPKLFSELERVLNADFGEIDFHSLILDVVLNEYRRNPSYYWSDDRIRAEAGGVALNARAGSYDTDPGYSEESSEEDDIRGIGYLARTIRTAIQTRLLDKHGIELPTPEEFDEEILITLIKDYGTQSYGLQIKNQTQGKLFHAHCYFGAKPNAHGPDRFGHFQLKSTTVCSDLDQLRFLVKHLDSMP